jgi:hypothetical protein
MASGHHEFLLATTAAAATTTAAAVTANTTTAAVTATTTTAAVTTATTAAAAVTTTTTAAAGGGDGVPQSTALLDSRLAIQEFLPLLRNPKFHYFIYTSPPLFPIGTEQNESISYQHVLFLNSFLTLSFHLS